MHREGSGSETAKEPSFSKELWWPAPIFTWNSFEETLPLRGSSRNSCSKAAPVVSWASPLPCVGPVLPFCAGLSNFSIAIKFLRGRAPFEDPRARRYASPLSRGTSRKIMQSLHQDRDKVEITDAMEDKRWNLKRKGKRILRLSHDGHGRNKLSQSSKWISKTHAESFFAGSKEKKKKKALSTSFSFPASFLQRISRELRRMKTALEGSLKMTGILQDAARPIRKSWNTWRCGGKHTMLLDPPHPPSCGPQAPSMPRYSSRLFLRTSGEHLARNTCHHRWHFSVGGYAEGKKKTTMRGTRSPDPGHTTSAARTPWRLRIFGYATRCATEKRGSQSGTPDEDLLPNGSVNLVISNEGSS